MLPPKHPIKLPEELDKLHDPLRFDGWLTMVKQYGEEATIEALIVWHSIYYHQGFALRDAWNMVRFFGIGVSDYAERRIDNPMPLSGRFLIDADSDAPYAEKTRAFCQVLIDAAFKEAIRD